MTLRLVVLGFELVRVTVDIDVAPEPDAVAVTRRPSPATRLRRALAHTVIR